MLVTLSPGIMAKLTPGRLRITAGLLSLKSMGAVVMTLRFRALSPQGYYWYNIPRQMGFPFYPWWNTRTSPFGILWYDHIIYIGDYLEVDHPNFQKSDQELLPVSPPPINPSLSLNG